MAPASFVIGIVSGSMLGITFGMALPMAMDGTRSVGPDQGGTANAVLDPWVRRAKAPGADQKGPFRLCRAQRHSYGGGLPKNEAHDLVKLSELGRGHSGSQKLRENLERDDNDGGLHDRSRDLTLDEDLATCVETGHHQVYEPPRSLKLFGLTLGARFRVVVSFQVPKRHRWGSVTDIT
ncbi:hypothetical protein NDU88_005440 [Pleurodeles waltl]|uniref:Uncharacterized protein n=1 Tax=Pleurodeles waltl TaxID=8319 RepID=A0AAV7TX52_PLEWA|nr:hypothetical protein NDU88_005440 [Pleurodeles waltl]